MEREWDQLSIETPELVDLEMPVAGIGSRFIALLIDYLIWLAFILLLIVLISYLGPSTEAAPGPTSKWAVAILILIPFLIFWGYFTLFEAFWNGRTPGKRIVRIRVIQKSGRGIGLFESMTRNFLRIVDQFPLIYGVGIVSIFLTKQHQRLGDLAAGTLVIHDRTHLAAAPVESTTRTFTAGILADVPMAPAPAKLGPSYPVERLRVTDLEVLEGFFARRLDLPLEIRAQLAERIAVGLLTRMGISAPSGTSTETFLEETARQLREIARLLPS